MADWKEFMKKMGKKERMKIETIVFEEESTRNGWLRVSTINSIGCVLHDDADRK